MTAWIAIVISVVGVVVSLASFWAGRVERRGASRRAGRLGELAVERKRLRRSRANFRRRLDGELALTSARLEEREQLSTKARHYGLQLERVMNELAPLEEEWLRLGGSDDDRFGED